MGRWKELIMVQEKNKPREVVVEVGFGKAWKLGELSGKNPDTVYIGMEVPSRVGKVESWKPNLVLDYKGGLVGLVELPNESVKQVVMDLVLDEDFTLTPIELAISFPMARINELSEGMLDGRQAEAMHTSFQFWRKQMLKQVKRVLKPDGTLEVNTSKGNLGMMEQLLKEVGFSYESKPATAEEIGKSQYMSGIAEKIRKGEDGFTAEMDGMMHITARKKPEIRERRLLPPPEK